MLVHPLMYLLCIVFTVLLLRICVYSISMISRRRLPDAVALTFFSQSLFYDNPRALHVGVDDCTALVGTGL